MTSSRPRRRNEIIILAAAILVLALGSPAAAELVIGGIGFPASAEAGQAIPVWVDISSSTPVDEVLLAYSNPGTGQMEFVLMNITSGTPADGRWSYDIPAQPWEGVLECRVTATDDAGISTQYTRDISIIGSEEPKPFPWNIVFIVAFLAVALVLTELVFKPGLYRKTGREKARELEEEDRKREEQEGAGKGV